MKTANEIIEELMRTESGAAAVACLGTDGMRQLLDTRADDALEAAAVLAERDAHLPIGGKYCRLANAIRAMKGRGK